MSNNNKVVSIAMGTYNGERFIEEQLQSIIDQDYPFIEIIICDDNSTDNTLQLLKKWEKNYPDKVFVSSNEFNLGFNKNFEKIIRSCQGDYIAISDQDDIWLPTKISKLVNLLDSSDAVMAHAASLNFKDTEYYYKYGVLNRTHLFEGNNTEKFFFYNHIQGHNSLFKKELKDFIFPFPTSVYYDHWIATVASTQKGGIKAINEYLVYHRIHGNNSYYSVPKDRRGELASLLKLFEALRAINNLSTTTRSVLAEAQCVLREKIEKKLGEFDSQLFNFLFKYREVFFGHRKRSFKIQKEWSILKACYNISTY